MDTRSMMHIELSRATQWERERTAAAWRRTANAKPKPFAAALLDALHRLRFERHPGPARREATSLVLRERTA